MLLSDLHLQFVESSNRIENKNQFDVGVSIVLTKKSFHTLTIALDCGNKFHCKQPLLRMQMNFGWMTKWEVHRRWQIRHKMCAVIAPPPPSDNSYHMVNRVSCNQSDISLHRIEPNQKHNQCRFPPIHCQILHIENSHFREKNVELSENSLWDVSRCFAFGEHEMCKSLHDVNIFDFCLDRSIASSLLSIHIHYPVFDASPPY